MATHFVFKNLFKSEYSKLNTLLCNSLIIILCGCPYDENRGIIIIPLKR